MMRIKKLGTFYIFFLFSGLFSCNSQAQKTYTIATYNVENLMDTLDNPHTLDNDFLPNGKLHWNSKRYWKKINSISEVIKNIGDPDGPEIIGLCEIENKLVLKDLVNSEGLKTNKYAYVSYDSPDERGIDVALLYKTDVFKLIGSKRYSASFEKIQSHTRDVLLVKGMLGHDTLFCLVNHWPSRRAGQEESEHKRIAVSIMAREIVDSIFQKNPLANIVVLGDFNDEPDNKSIQISLSSKNEVNQLKASELYNPFYNLKEEVMGSLKYKHEWNMMDQIMVSKKLTDKGGLKYKDHSASVYNPAWLHYKKNLNDGPYRTYMGTKYNGGYSDHFPVYIQLVK